MLDRVDPANSPRRHHDAGGELARLRIGVRRFGQCLESTYAYNPGSSPGDTLNSARPQAADTEAARFKLETRFLNPNSVDDIKAALAGGSPVPISFPVYNSWFRGADTIQTGRINMPIDGEARVGGHAVCLVGYQDDDLQPGGGFFILRNSWQRVGLELGGVASSVLWAENSQFGTGYGTMPYAYMAKLGTEALRWRTSRPAWTAQDPQDQGGILDIFSLPGGREPGDGRVRTATAGSGRRTGNTRTCRDRDEGRHPHHRHLNQSRRAAFTGGRGD